MAGITAPSAALFTPRRVATVFVGLQIGMIVSTLDGTIVATALPTIAADVDAGSQRSWIITAYLLGQVATMPLYGKLGDLYGRKRLYLFALGLFTVASMLCGLAGSFEVLVACRALQGIGAGGLGPLAMAVIADIVPARQLGRWLGYQGALFAIASLVGPLTGGVFVDTLSWRWAFYINLPLAFASAAIVTTTLALPYRRIPHSIDYPGAALLTTALVGVVLTASLGGDDLSWRSPAIIALATAVVALLVAFTLRERTAREPVVPPRLFRQSIARITSGTNFTSGVLFASGIYFLPVFWQQVRDLSPTRSGLLLIPYMFTTAGATLVAGRRVERSGRYRRWPIAGAVLMLGGLGLLTTIDAGTAPLSAAAFGAVLGTGVGFVMQTSLLAFQNSIDHRDLGVATSTALLSRILGSTIGAALLSAVLEARLPDEPARDPGAYANALRGVYLAAIPVGIVALVLALRLQERPLRDDAQFAPPA
jgi:EmrB/QacA subfamily drug resistance transporter